MTPAEIAFLFWRLTRVQDKLNRTEKQKAIAVAFATYDIWQTSKTTEENYFDWLLTEDGKRLTAEVPEPRVIQGVWAVPEEKHRAAITNAQKSEPAYDLLVKISAQLDRIEGNMKVVVSEDLPKLEGIYRKRIIIDEHAKKLGND